MNTPSEPITSFDGPFTDGRLVVRIASESDQDVLEIVFWKGDRAVSHKLISPWGAESDGACRVSVHGDRARVEFFRNLPFEIVRQADAFSITFAGISNRIRYELSRPGMAAELARRLRRDR